MISILFVCLGNICRSPMAEAIMKHYAAEEGLKHKIAVDSAGTGDWHIGKPPHEGTRRILDSNTISYEGLLARKVEEKDLTSHHYIIAMDAENLGNLRRMAGYTKTGYIGRLLDFVDEANLSDVPDPYFTNNFEETYELISSGCKHLLQYIKKEHNL
ncbi:low molecular weight phosphotyrosine protein phosphatase [Bacillus lacus]|uniref:protein-tyrosine-phosphatase n=1 Tax=Metabacillus lacus TaxID=1983721 RepID=A0A7X2J125_9BACI|nr:low molecular weight protein-tyrosine-phosphatase [Metabacillus lacus]MRX73361.1 low molecular weight phosphotyrosine protein phosphatase [Metabacillus lacus]